MSTDFTPIYTIAGALFGSIVGGATTYFTEKARYKQERKNKLSEKILGLYVEIVRKLNDESGKDLKIEIKLLCAELLLFTKDQDTVDSCVKIIGADGAEKKRLINELTDKIGAKVKIFTEAENEWTIWV